MSDDCSSTKAIKRLKYTLKSSEFGKLHGIRIHQYLGSSTKGFAALSFKNVRHLSKPLVMPKEVGYKLLWQTSRSLRNDPTLYWLGFMQELLKSETPVQKSTITFWPIIDLNPNDESCIYSTLLFVIEQAKRMRVPVPCVTFDQLLWLKACGIIEEGGLDIVARLGGFHTLMTFTHYLGAIGKVMKGSGIEELFNEVYFENTVQHIMPAKAVSRALRAHLLTEFALISILFEDTEAVNIAEVNEFVSILVKKSLEEIETFCQTPEAREIGAALEKRMQELRERSRTAKLWLQYWHHIQLLKRFIIAERTSNWSLHLQSTTDILNLFTASRHLNYAKSARLYAQQMMCLSEKHPWFHEQFENGKHAVRRN